MILFSVIVSILLLLALCCKGDQSVTLQWDPSTDPEVTGAIVYYGNAIRNYPYHTNFANVTRATVTGLQAGLTYFFAVTATNTAGLESDYSNEVSTSIPTDLTNRPPTIAFVPDLTVRKNASTNVALLVWDVETPPGNLTVSACSTDPLLLPPDTMIVTGTNHNRVLKLVPTPGAHGQTLVTVDVSDGMKSTSTTFFFTVQDTPEAIVRLTFVSNLQVSTSPDGPWSNILSTILPVDISGDTGRFYRTWVNLKP